jgi:large subunit ribosomal protein L3
MTVPPRRWLSGATEAEVATKEAGLGVRWTPDTRRVGAIGIKCGMMSLFDGYGVRHGVTVVLLDDVLVIKLRAPPGDEVTAVQLGLGARKLHRREKALRGQFRAAGLTTAKAKIAEFQVSPDAMAGLEVGTPIGARHFVPGQYLDVQSVSKGHGTTGVMKRWGFKGGPASHGSSLFHRKGGSSGALGPSRVLKGKKMAGRMGRFGSRLCW